MLSIRAQMYLTVWDHEALGESPKSTTLLSCAGFRRSWSANSPNAPESEEIPEITDLDDPDQRSPGFLKARSMRQNAFVGQQANIDLDSGKP